MHNWLLLSVVALVFWGLTGVTQKLSTNNISFRRSFVWFAVAFGVQAGLIAVFVPLDWHITPSLMALAALGGLLNGLGVLTSFLALERGGKASIVVALVSIYPLLTIAGAWLFLGEKLSGKQAAGVFCALVAIVLLAQESAPKAAAAIERHGG